MPDDLHDAEVPAALAQVAAAAQATAAEPEETAVDLPQLEASLRLIRRYAFLYSDTPFTSAAPLVGPLIASVKNLARRLLRGIGRLTLGSQAEFNAAVAEVLFEFTRRATLAEGAAPPSLPEATRTEMELASARQRLANSADPGARALLAAMEALVREMAALEASVRAANLSAAETERMVAELRLTVERLQSARRE